MVLPQATSTKRGDDRSPCPQQRVLVTSRGGRVQRRTLDTGQLLEEHLFEGVEAPLEHHFKHGEHDLLCTTDGMVTWLANMAVVQQAQLSGPVQDATWDEQLNGWRVAGWREEVVVSPTILDRRATDELPVHIVPTETGPSCSTTMVRGSRVRSHPPVKTNNSLNGGRVAASTARFPVVVDGQKDARSTVGTVLGASQFSILNLVL